MSALSSMTGFGRAHSSKDGVTVIVELRSVNQKGKEIKLRLPRALAPIENDLIKLVASHIDRGRVDGSVDVTTDSASARVIDEHRLAAIVHAMRAMPLPAAGISRDATMGQLLALPGVLIQSQSDTAADENVAVLARAAMSEATAALVTARSTEGDGLHAELVSRRGAIAALVEQLAERSDISKSDKQKNLNDKLRALLGGAIDAGRLTAEVSVLIEKLDVSEELTRLRLHLTQLDTLLATPSSGRRLDFLCQELLREANTTASKCQDALMAHLTVELKAEIEKLREQAQNIE